MPTFTDKAKRLERARVLLKQRFGDMTHTPITNPVDHAVRTILAEGTTAAQVDAAMARLHDRFVDMNDLRVSRPREVREVLGEDFPRSGNKARVIPRLLDQVFKQHNSMVWDFLETMGKLQMRTYFEKLEEVRPFVAATLARDCGGAHAFPVDSDVARVLGRLEIVDPSSESEEAIQAFLERAVKAGRAYELHRLIRQLAEELCVAERPNCSRCPLKAGCPAAAALAKAGQPKKGAKTAAKARPKKAATRAKTRKKAKKVTKKKAAKKKPTAATAGRKTKAKTKAKPKKTARKKARRARRAK